MYARVLVQAAVFAAASPSLTLPERVRRVVVVARAVVRVGSVGHGARRVLWVAEARGVQWWPQSLREAVQSGAKRRLHRL